ncbi:acyltransferase [Kitasatospora sp. NBC_01287]|uniref:acyltransferase n=1 Tax=Kitasatospora sp. NBC_01287 TaxID=2903573 RepID=UPI00225619CD|nr:acyltransferase [Kitasatospora sp. NBC_01287]MCX4750750.1 acyltransferase [Kitasatospora sp. NBC_01287]
MDEVLTEQRTTAPAVATTTAPADATRTVRAGSAPGTTVRCGLPDLMLADLAVSVVFCFPRALDADRMAAGLARALARAPIFAGRLRTAPDGTLEIRCTDDGVPFTTAVAPDTLPEVLGRLTLTAAGYTDHVQATAARTGGHPLLTVRLTRLADGGTALGCSWHHALGDMQTFMVLMSAWSAAVEGTEAPEITVVEDRDAYLDSVLPPTDAGRPGFRLPDAADAARLTREIEQAALANRTVQVYFTDDEPARMRAEFSEQAGTRLSTNDVLTAHLMSTLRQLDENHDEQYLTMPVNLRRFLDAPPGVLGNLLGEVYLAGPPDQAPAELAAAIRAAVTDFTGSHLSLRASRAFLDALGRERLRDCVPLGFDPARKTFTLSSWCRTGIYRLSFEGQRPSFFSPTGNLPLPWVSWLVEGFEGSGYLLTVVLPARLAAKVRSAAGRAALHQFREPADVLPPLAGAVRKLV